MNRTLTLIGAALFGASCLALAQAPAAGESKAKERHQQMRDRMKGAHEACKDKPDRQACMREQMCAKAPDPAKCAAEGRERMHKRMDERQAMHEACTGKRGDELQKCLGEQHKQQRGARRDEHREHRK